MTASRLLSACQFAAIVVLHLLSHSAHPAPLLVLDKQVNNDTPTLNEPIEFTLTLRNDGDETATSVQVRDQLPPGLVIPDGMAAFTGTGSYDESSGFWNVGDLPAGADGVLTLPAVREGDEVPPCVVNIASAMFGDTEEVVAEARAAVRSDSAQRCVDLRVTFGLSASAPFIFPNCDSQDRYSGIVTVTNFGPDNAFNVAVVMQQDPVIAPGLRFDDASCDNIGGPSCQIDVLNAGESVTLPVTSNLYQSYTTFSQVISAEATSSGVDYDLSNNSPSVASVAGGFSDCSQPDFGLPDGVGPGACFIATAAWGTSLDPHLDVLRDFRDQHLQRHAWGRRVVALYYRHSPPIAAFIAERPALRAVVRWILTPVVFAIRYPLAALLLVVALIVTGSRLFARFQRNAFRVRRQRRGWG